MRVVIVAIFSLLFSGCISLKDVYGFGFLKSDKDKLMQSLMDKCESKSAISCNNLAYEYSKDKDFKSSSEFFKRACDLNLATACANLGQIYEKGLVGKKDINMALALYTLACDSGDGVGCYNIALATYTNAPANKKDIALNRSLKLLDKSCKLEYRQACLLLKELSGN